ncbi:MAG: branched-chain amino acid ABC transporter permease, partial [Actinomycetota bacterium]|nr:branched-chain amino acid ABC transporter permease [Actinomycetota bacterium]
LGGVLRVSPPALRRPVTTAVTVTLLFGFLQRVIPIALDQLSLERDWLYSPQFDGLTWLGAAVVAGVAAAISILRARFGAQLRGRFDRARGRDGTAISPALLLVGLAALGLLLAAPLLLGSVISEVLGTVLVFALLGLGLNIVVGYAGLLDLGYVFFFALGAYSVALLTGATLNAFGIPPEPAISGSLNFYVAIPIVMVIAAVAGLLVGAPVLRLRGDYLALVTLGLGEIVTVLLASPWLVPLVGGPSGMRGITDAAIGGFGFRDPQHFYYLALAFVGLAAFVSWRLASSRIGRAWTAMREDEQTADAMGISTTSYKLLAFAIGGAIGSLGGALFAVKIGSLTPASFQLIVSIQVLGLVILGGIGSIPGVLVGALVLVGLPGLLREFEEYRFLAYGAAVVAVMILRPQGLIPNVRRSRELKDEESAQDEWAKAVEEGESSPDIATETGATT